MYDAVAAPPREAGADQDNVADPVPVVTLRESGADGGASGVPVTGVEKAPVPAATLAAT